VSSLHPGAECNVAVNRSDIACDFAQEFDGGIDAGDFDGDDYIRQ